MEDSVVQEVKDLFESRSQVGIKKYKKTLQNNDDGVMKFLTHAQEEAMDLTLYIQKLKNEMKYAMDLEMTKLYHALLLAQEAGGDKPLAPCDVEDVFFQLGHDIDKLPF